MKRLPLEGMKVLDFTIALAGLSPLEGRYGAEV